MERIVPMGAALIAAAVAGFTLTCWLVSIDALPRHGAINSYLVGRGCVGMSDPAYALSEDSFTSCTSIVREAMQ